MPPASRPSDSSTWASTHHVELLRLRHRHRVGERQREHQALQLVVAVLARAQHAQEDVQLRGGVPGDRPRRRRSRQRLGDPRELGQRELLGAGARVDACSREEVVRAPGVHAQPDDRAPHRLAALARTRRRRRARARSGSTATGGDAEPLQPHDDRRHLRPRPEHRRRHAPHQLAASPDTRRGRSPVRSARRRAPRSTARRPRAAPAPPARSTAGASSSTAITTGTATLYGKVRAEDPRSVRRARSPSRCASRRRRRTSMFVDARRHLAERRHQRPVELDRPDARSGRRERQRRASRARRRPRRRDRPGRRPTRRRSPRRGSGRSGSADRAPWRARMP